MSEGAHPDGHQRADHPRAALHVLRELAVLGGLTLLSLASGCDLGHPSTQPIDAPPVKLVDVQVATAIDADGLPTSYKSIDAAGTVKDAVVTTSIKLRFDRFLLPSDTFRQSICVQSDLKPVKSLRDCTAGPVFFEPTYDPIHREITYRQSADQSKTHIAGTATYRVTVFPPDSTGANGIAAFDGAPLDAVAELTFGTTDVAPPANAKVDQIPTSPFFCDTVYPALSGCAYGGCHLDQGKGNTGAAEGLDLSTPALIALTAVGHVAHQTEEGEHAKVGDRSPLRFGRAMPLVDPGFPGNSYLVYKLLASHANTQGLSDPPSDAEVTRVRASVVVGMPMPPSNGTGAALTKQEQLDALSAWILQGAPTPACP